MKEATVHPIAVNLPNRAAIGVGQNRLRPELPAAAFPSRAPISSSASSQPIRAKAAAPGVPLGAILRIGLSSRSGE